MSYRRWFHNTVIVFFSMMFLLAGGAWLVDPIELWEAPVIRGFNHIKPKQAVFLDVLKPFQVQRHKPDIIYIGNSRVYMGFRPEENAYNMGVSSVSLPDMREYLRFIYSNHMPKKVFIGLDLFQFCQASMTMQREGFSKDRLTTLKKGLLASIGEAMETSYGLIKYLKETVKSSLANRDKSKEWERGFDIKHGERIDVDEKSYYSNLNKYHKIYTDYTYDPESLLCLQDILKDAASKDVEIVCFFNPVSIDLLTLQHICGREEEYRRIKANVAKLYPVYDFAWVSAVTLDREGSWLDGSHYRRPVGDRMKASMTGNVDSEICRVLTAENVDTHLREEAELFDRWATEHSAYIQVLTEAAPQKIPEGTLAQYLGF